MKIFKYFIFILLGLFITGNLLLLDFNVYSKKDEVRTADINPLPKIIITPVIADNSCPSSCLTEIKTATASIIIPTPEVIYKKEQITVPVNNVRETYITFGSGQTTAVNYESLAGIESYVDTANYRNLQKVVFECTLSVPTNNGIVKAQLYNVTDNHPVWNSEITATGEKPLLLESAPINLDSGKKLYRVQLLSSLGYPAVISNARIKINLK